MDSKETIMSRFEDVDKVLSVLFPNENIELYVAGGIGCLLVGATIRPTMDFDFIDLDTPSKYLRALNAIGDYDFIDITVSAMADDFKNRAKESYSGNSLKVYTVSAEDLIVMKLNRYDSKDIEDINALLKLSNVDLLFELISTASSSMYNAGSRKKYLENVKKFKEVLRSV